MRIEFFVVVEQSNNKLPFFNDKWRVFDPINDSLSSALNKREKKNYKIPLDTTQNHTKKLLQAI